MRSGRYPLALRLAIWVAVGSGWFSLSASAQAAAPSAPSHNAVAEVHWRGMKQVALGPGVDSLRWMMSLPQAAKLGDQILTKVSQAPWLGRDGTTNQAHPAGALLLPLLRTAVANEGYLELQAEEAALALRLGEAEIVRWRKELPPVLNQWPGLRPAGPEGVWHWQEGSAKAVVRMERASDCLLISFGPDRGTLASTLRERLVRGSSPFKSSPTNVWLNARFKWPEVQRWLKLGLPLPDGLRQVQLNVGGEGDYVRTDAQFVFAQALNLKLEPWAFPTNVIHEPLVSFAAVRGFRGWLSSQPLVKALNPPNVPNHLYLWSLDTGPMFNFAAMPMPGAVNWMDQVAADLQRRASAWVKEHKGGGLMEWSAENHSLTWSPVPLITPALQGLATPQGELLIGRFGPPPVFRGQPPPAELLDRVTSVKDLVYYHWEVTQPRVAQWLFLSQSGRVAFDRTQIYVNSPIFEFLLAAKTRMGNTVTDIRWSGPSTLTLLRKSPSGFTGMEWHLLGDWIESPQFPRGLHSLLRHGSGLPTYRDFLKGGAAPATNAPGKK